MTTNLVRQRQSFRGSRRSRGLAMVEFVLTVPVIIFIMIVAAEIGRAIIQYGTLSYSIRSAARFVSQNAIRGTSGDIEISQDVVTKAGRLAVFGNLDGVGERCLKNFEVGQVAAASAGNGNIIVSATYTYQPIFKTPGLLPPILSNSGGGGLGGAFDMTIAVVMRAIT